MKKENIYRVAFYLLGMIVLAAGITLNTKTNLGVSPIISVSFCFSQISGINVGNATFLWYSTLVLFEVIIHIFINKKKLIPYDILQIVVSLIFTRFMNLYSNIIPNLTIDVVGSFWSSMSGKLIALIVAIVLTGIGAALSLNARIIPNPGDGIVQAISDLIGKSTGFCKNGVDIMCVIISIVMGMLLVHQILGIGIGTILAMIGVGRVIAIFNHFTMKPIQNLSGINPSDLKNR